MPLKIPQDSSVGIPPSTYGSILHKLGSKLLPIVVFSELGLLGCHDKKTREHLEKIHRSATEVQKLIQDLREWCQTDQKLGEGKNV